MASPPGLHTSQYVEHCPEQRDWKIEAYSLNFILAIKDKLKNFQPLRLSQEVPDKCVVEEPKYEGGEGQHITEATLMRGLQGGLAYSPKIWLIGC
eukprot:1153366-Pelagomonas_calceolata.AAC.1